MIDIMMEPVFDATAKIKVIGVGGAGGNAVNRMIEEGLDGVDFITINTDAAALDNNKASKRIQIGVKLTGGLGAGANPNIGKTACEENIDEITAELEDTDMVFIAAGMGGGTGTGAAAVVAKAAKDKNILTVAVVTKPFLFEGKVRDRNCSYGIGELRKYVDTIIVIENQKLLSIVPKGTPLLEGFKTADGVLNDATKGISRLITVDGIVNVDFADVKSVMTEMGDALMGVGESDDPDNRAVIAAEMAINSPLLEDIDITGAEGLLVNCTGGYDISLDEVNAAMERINEAIGEDADTNIIFGANIDERMTGKIQITVVATGFNKESNRKKASEVSGIDTPVNKPVQIEMPAVAKPKVERVEVEAEPVIASEQTLPPIVDVETIETTPNTITPSSYPNESEAVVVAARNDIETPAYLRGGTAYGNSQQPYGNRNTATTPNDREVPAFLRQQMQ